MPVYSPGYSFTQHAEQALGDIRTSDFMITNTGLYHTATCAPNYSQTN